MKIKLLFKKLAVYFFAGVGLFCSLAPLYWLVTISLKKEVDQFASPPLWVHFTPTLEHFVEAFYVKPFGKYLFNSCLVATVSTIIALLVGIPAAYSLTRLKWPKNQAEKIGFWILSNRFLPPIITIVPLFLMMRNFDLL